jgi:hypothetical protein
MLKDDSRLLKALKSISILLESIQKQLEAISKQSKADICNDEPRQHKLIVSVDSLPPTIPSYYESENNERPTKQKWERIKRGLEFAGLAAVVAYVIVTACTLSEIKRQAASAQEQVSIMRKQIKLSERAIVLADPPQEFFDYQSVKIRIHNTGRVSTGPFMVWVSVFRFLGNKSITTKEGSKTFRPDKKRIPPGGYIDFVVPIFEASRTDMAAIRTGQQTLYVNVEVRYDNGFEETLTSRGQFVYAGPMGWHSNIPVYGVGGREEKLPPEKDEHQK